jgi:superfamily II DNA/RNA helicase
MVWADKFKLNKQLIKAVNDAGFDTERNTVKNADRITGGQDVIGIGPEGCGKTTTFVLATLNRFNHKADGVPRALILAPDQEKVFEIVAQFDRLNRNKTIRIVSLHAGHPGTEQQMDDLADGADIVVATPDRARAIYLKLGLNLNKVDFLAVDDAHLIIKQRLQLPVVELANSIGKAQHMVFSEVMHDKLEKMIAPFMQCLQLLK